MIHKLSKTVNQKVNTAQFHSDTYQYPEKPFFPPRIYFDFGCGFKEDNKIELREIGNNNFRTKIELSKGCIRFRLDPTENANCVVRNMKLKTEDRILQVVSHNGEETKDQSYLFLDTKDPQFIYETEGIERMEINIELQISFV
ncbi:MAG: hypothetical protein PHY47_15540 [Lachnospiraceae bacterium]|nr:hypothetical protein [Lachnospiraceae bacterium]